MNKELTYKFPIDKSDKSRSEIATESDLNKYMHKLLSIVKLDPLPATMHVGSDLNIAYGYRSKSSDINPYGSLDIAPIVYSKIVAFRSLNDNSNSTYIVVSEAIPYDYINVSFNNGNSTAKLIVNRTNPTKYEVNDSTLAAYIISANGTDIDISLDFGKN